MLHSEALQVPGAVQVLEAGQKVQASLDPARVMTASHPGPAVVLQGHIWQITQPALLPTQIQAPSASWWRGCNTLGGHLSTLGWGG